jgi:hypothetical protein
VTEVVNDCHCLPASSDTPLERTFDTGDSTLRHVTDTERLSRSARSGPAYRPIPTPSASSSNFIDLADSSSDRYPVRIVIARVDLADSSSDRYPVRIVIARKHGITSRPSRR